MSWLAFSPRKANWYSVFKQLSDAIRFRRQAIDFPFGMHVSRRWFIPTVTVPGGLTATSFTTTQTWRGGTGSGDPTYADPWNGNETDIYAPTSWYVVFDHCNADLVVKARVISWTNAGQLTYQDLTDWVTAGIIPSIASLAGRTWTIIRGDRGLWTSDLVLEWPNARECAKGTITEYHDDPDNPMTVTNPTHTTMKDGDNSWDATLVVGCDLLMRADDGFLKRVTVTAYAAGVFTFATQSWTPAVAAHYCVVQPGKRAIPGDDRSAFNLPPANHSLFSWYRGLRSLRISSHLGTPEFVLKPDQIKLLDIFDGAACSVETVRAFDEEVWTEDEPDPNAITCGRLPEKCYTPDYFKAIRAYQKKIEELAALMYERKSYNGVDFIAPMRPARMFQMLGLPTISLTTYSVVGASGNSVTFSSIAGSLPYSAVKVHWSLNNGQNDAPSGTGLLTATTLETAPLSALIDNFTAGVSDAAGCSILIAFGWDSFPPLEVAQMHPKTGWIADTADGLAIDPIVFNYGEDGCNGLGYWFKRPASTNYLNARTEDPEWSVEGIMLETGAAFANGDIARYVGRNWANPSAIGIDGLPVSPDDPAGDYFGKMAVTYADRSPSLGGSATGATPTQIQNVNVDWWRGNGAIRTESGEATGGSTTSLIDSTKTSEPDQCGWHAARFRGFTSVWAGFTLEVLMSGTDFDDPDAVIEKAFIATGNESTGTLTWSGALSATASGKQYRIREPKYELNCFEGRTINVTRNNEDGTSTAETKTVLGNDDTTLFLNSALSFTPDARTTYAIADPVVGDVFRRVSGAWTIATGADAVRQGVTSARDFTKNPAFNLPGYLKRGGRCTFRDAICGVLITQMQNALDLLQDVAADASWASRDVIDVPIDNALEADAGTGSGACDVPTNGDPSSLCVVDPSTGLVHYVHLHDEVPLAADRWARGAPPAAEPFEDIGPPRAQYRITRQYHPTSDTPNSYGEYAGDFELAEVRRRWSRLHTNLFALRPCGVSSDATIDWYGYSQVNEADDPTGFSNADNDLVVFESGPINVQYHKWTLLDTVAADGVVGGDYQSGRIGEDSTAPTAPPLPSDTPDYTDDGLGNAGPTKHHLAGFYVARQLAIVKRTFTIPTPA